jgi:hypothetical protein
MIQIGDPWNFIPIMDYHMQRVLLRTGCVEVTGQEREDLILRNPTVQEPEIRSACIESMKIIARMSGHPIWVMNDFFWPLGRSCCHEKPLCVHKKCEKEPCSLYLIAALTNHQQCLLEPVCKGKSDPEYRSLWQPVIQTHFY